MKPNEARKAILNAIEDILSRHPDSSMVTDEGIAERLGLDLQPVRDYLELMQQDGYVIVSKQFGGWSAKLAAKGRLALAENIKERLRQYQIDRLPTGNATEDKPFLDVTPSTGPLGTYFTVRGRNFKPNEEVIVWFKTPSGVTRRFPPTYIPDETGSFRFVPYDASTPALMEIGTWELFSKGSKSGKTESVYFEVEPFLKLTRPLRVFLCHSSADKPTVRQLYHQLRIDGIDPWLDEEKLLPGQEWRLEISNAVRDSDIVIVCLSCNSVSKAGYVNKEIKMALDVAEEQPEGAIFLIPLRLEESDVPERLRRWHWVDYFEPKGFERLILALKTRATELGLIQAANK